MTEDLEQPIWVQAILDENLTATDHRLFAYLNWRQGKNEEAWPSQITIARELHVSGRTIRNSTRQLQNRGYIEVDRIENQGRGQYLKYHIKGGSYIPPLQPEGGTPVPPLEDKRRKKTTTKGGTDSTTNTIQGTHTKRERAHTTFQKPSVDEVNAYSQSIGYDLDAEYFVNYYEARGWMLKNAPMRDWKATVKTWRARDKKPEQPTLAVPIERGPDGLTPRERELKRIGVAI